MMFDGALVADMAVTVSDAQASSQTDAPASAHQATQDTGPNLAEQVNLAVAGQPGERRDLVFVDTRLPDYQQIVAAIAPNADVILIDSQGNGVQQIADALVGRSGIDAIHIISHGDDGVLLLGDAPLHGGNLEAHAAQLSAIGAALTADGDILLYGCDVGRGDKGLSFLEGLATATGADVAASTNATGNSAGGGDWDLEIATGHIAASAVLEYGRLQAYDAQLATFSVSTLGELQTALTTSASNGAADTITFTANITATGTGSLTSEYLAYINLAETQALTIVGGGYTLDAAYFGSTVYVSAGDNVEIQNLTIRGGLAAGDGATSGAAGAAAAANALGAGIHNLGTLTLRNVNVRNNLASGGGGGGGVASSYVGGGGGGGGGFNGIGGGAGGSVGPGTGFYAGVAGAAGSGGRGGGYSADDMGGRGGSSTGGAGGVGTLDYSNGGAGASATNGSLSIGGGGGGAGWDAVGGTGGSAAGGIFNGVGATLTIVGTSVISNNLGAGGGGGGGSGLDSNDLDGGAGGRGVGAIWNEGTLNITASNLSAMSANAGASGAGGLELGAGVAGASPAAQNTIYGAGTQNLNYIDNTVPVLGGAGGTSAATEQLAVAVATALTLTDAEQITLPAATVSITGNFVSGQDVLAFTNDNAATFGNIAASYNAGTGVLSLTSAGATATLAQFQAALRAVTYTNTSDAPTTSNRTVSFVANDGIGNSTAVTQTVTVAAVNDAPVLTPGAPVLTGINDSDTNNAGQTVASIVGSSIGDGDSGAVEGIAITGLASGNGTWQYSTDGGSNWSDVGSVSTSSALLLSATDKVRFVPDGVTATAGSITYQAWDQSGATAGQQGSKVDVGSNGGSSAFSTSTDTASITVTAVDNAALVTTSGGTTAFTEGNNLTSTPVAIDAGLTLSDSDSATLASATVSITGNFQSGQDVLAFSNDGSSMGNINASYNAGTGVMTLTSAGASATLAQWQAALRSVTYTNGAETPNTTVRTLSIVVNDGNSDSLTVTQQVSVASINDAPIVSVPVSIGVAEDVASALTGISFSDADAGGASVTVTLSVGSGSLAASGGGGVIVGGSSSARTLTGTVANINAFIAGSNVSFTTASNTSADVVLTASIDDGGNTGTGGAQTDSDTTTLQVSAVNDAPVVTTPISINVNEDVSTALTGISFADVDAGGSVVTATFSVPSGTLSANSGAGVGVTGSGTGSLTLSGSIADINAFIAASGVSFTTASNATGNVTLTVAIDDGGNTGSGGNLADSDTVTLMVTAANDAPVNGVPGTQAVDQDAALIFSSGNGNLISIGDVDAGGGTLRVTLTASNGLITLPGTSGLNFIVGSGANDGTMTFEGSIADINTALNGLLFSPTAGYNGAASLQITTSDLGLSGSGGTQADSDTIGIAVAALNPRVIEVQAGNPDGLYREGDVITLMVTFDQAVIVSGGIPTLLLETGATDRSATYVSGSGTTTLSFSYTVQAGDGSADLDYQSAGALALNGATIRSVGNDDAIATLPPTGGVDSIAGQHDIVINTVRPTVTVVVADNALTVGETSGVTITFSEAVNGFDNADLTVENGTLSPVSSSDGGITWTATLTPTANTADASNLITLNNTGVENAVGNSGSGSTDSNTYAIDTQRPTATIVVADNALSVGETSLVTITFSEAVTGFDNADLTVESGTLSTVSSSDGGITWTATLTPTASLTDTLNVITLGNAGVMDLAGNAGQGSTPSNVYAINTVVVVPPVEPPVPPVEPPVPPVPPVEPPPPVPPVEPPLPPVEPPVPPVEPPLPPVEPPLPPTVDPEFLVTVGLPPEPSPPSVPAPLFGSAPPNPVSPLAPPALFDTPGLGSGIPPLGNIFIRDGALAPSFIAQVFGSSDSGGDGSGSGFLGFGGGDAGVFGSSTLSAVFGKDVPQESMSLNTFGNKLRGGGDVQDGLRGIFSALSLGQQLQQLHEREQGPVRDLAQALAQFGQAADTAAETET
ncbi:MAG: Ig-like domain-containing protein [Pseudomonadota bacterium]